MFHLRPWRCVPLKARPFKAGVLIYWSLAAVTLLVLTDLDLSTRDADTKHGPSLYTTSTCCVALGGRRQWLLDKCWQIIIFQTHRCHLHPLPVLGQPVWRAFVVSAGDEWPEVCSPVSTETQVLLGPLVFCSTHAALFFHAHRCPNTE